MQCLQYYQRFAMSKSYDIFFSGFGISGCYFLRKSIFYGDNVPNQTMCTVIPHL